MKPPATETEAAEKKKTLEEQVDYAFGQLKTEEYATIQSYVSVLIERLSNAERSAARSLTTFLLAWLIAYLISKGFVKESDLAGLKIEKLQALLVIAPLILGFISYTASTAIAGFILLEETIRLTYMKLIPKLSGTDLDTLFAGDTFIGAEHISFTTKGAKLNLILKYVVLGCIVLLCWLAPLVAIGHVTEFLLELGDWPRALIFSSATAGVVLWMRGATMIYSRL